MSFLLIGKQTLLDDATELWGIRVARVEIKDVRIPVQLQRSMAAEAEATREARARVRATSCAWEGGCCLVLGQTRIELTEDQGLCVIFTERPFSQIY